MSRSGCLLVAVLVLGSVAGGRVVDAADDAAALVSQADEVVAAHARAPSPLPGRHDGSLASGLLQQRAGPLVLRCSPAFLGLVSGAS